MNRHCLHRLLGGPVLLFCLASLGLADSTPEMLACAVDGDWHQILSLGSPEAEVPESPLGRLLVGYASLEAQDWVRARSCLALCAPPELSHARAERELAQAASDIRQIAPAHPLAGLLDAHRLLLSDFPQSALDQLPAHSTATPPHPLAAELKAALLLATGSPVAAEHTAAAILNKDPERAHALFLRALAAWQADSLEVASSRFGCLCESFPGFPFGWNSHGVCLAEGGDLPGALSCFEVALELDPGFAIARENRDAILHLRGSTTLFLNEMEHLATQLAAMGTLGSLFIVVGDQSSMASARQEALRHVRDLTGREPKITPNVALAKTWTAQGYDVIVTKQVSSLQQAGIATDAARNLDRAWRATRLLNTVTQAQLPPKIMMPMAFSGAVIRDLRSAKRGEFRVLTSSSLERFGEVGIQTIRAAHGAGGLRGLMVTPGVENFVKGISSQVGRRSFRPTIREVEHYCDGFAKATAYTAVRLAGGDHRMGSIAAQASGLAADLGRDATRGPLEFLAMHKVRRQMRAEHNSHCEAAWAHGVPASDFSQMYDAKLLVNAGFSAKEIQNRDQSARAGNWDKGACTTVPKCGSGPAGVLFEPGAPDRDLLVTDLRELARRRVRFQARVRADSTILNGMGLRHASFF